MKIGIFDSGVGGLTILQIIKKNYPSAELIYFGDTLRMPYGDKSKEEIVQYSHECATFLQKKGAEMIVIACNTSATIAGHTLKKTFSIPIYDVIEGGVQSALKQTKTDKIAVIGTFRSITSHIHAQKIQSLSKKPVVVLEKSCPLLAPMIEKGGWSAREMEDLLREYLDDLIEKVDTFLLGCTHYSLIKKEITQLYANKKIFLADSLDFFNNFLPKNKENTAKNGEIKIYTSQPHLDTFFFSIVSKLFSKEKIFLNNHLLDGEKIPRK